MEERLRRHTLAALRYHTLECVARFLGVSMSTVKRWAYGTPFRIALYFKGAFWEEDLRVTLENLEALGLERDCVCQQGFDFSILDRWRKQACRHLPTFS